MNKTSGLIFIRDGYSRDRPYQDEFVSQGCRDARDVTTPNQPDILIDRTIRR